MQALAKLDPESPGIDLVDVADPAARQADEVVVRVELTGISGSEVNIWRGVYRLPSGAPISSGRILGYEHAGVVVEAGPAARPRGFEPGQRVALATPFIGCGQCLPCEDGYVNRCRSWGHVGITLDGTDAEYASLPASVLLRIPDDVDSIDAAFVNMAGLALRALARSDFVAGDSVVVVGPGAVGLTCLQAARAAGARWTAVVGLEKDAARLALAEKLGSDRTFRNEPNPRGEIFDTLDGLGADVVIEAAGTPEAVQLSVDLVRVGGTVVLAGLPPSRQAPFEAIRTTRDELTIRGVEGSLGKDRRRALALMQTGALSPKALVTHRFALADATEAFETVMAGTACKATFEISKPVAQAAITADRQAAPIA